MFVLAHDISQDTTKLASDDPSNKDGFYFPDDVPGQYFHMDFGFVRGSKHFHIDFGFICESEYRVKNADGLMIKSVDGYNLYLIIVDRVTHYIWIFLTFSKIPPITIAQKVLNKFKYGTEHRIVCTDQEGDFGLSKEFQEMIGSE